LELRSELFEVEIFAEVVVGRHPRPGSYPHSIR
jgi:hypothetical protein